MIAYISGTLESVQEQSIIVDNNGMGYRVLVSPATIARLPRAGNTIKIYTYMNVKEDGVTLFGFLSAEEMNIFNMLISVSGVGPKIGLQIAAAMSPAQIMLAIVTDDISTLSKAPGVGKKTAQRLVLELRDKIKTDDVSLERIGLSGAADSFPDAADVSGASGEKRDAIDALMALDYSRSEAVRAVMEVGEEGMATAQIVRLALKRLARA